MTDSNQNMQANDEMTLKELILLVREYWGVLWEKKWYIFITGLIMGLIFGVLELQKPTTYSAKLTFMINEDDGSGLGLSIAQDIIRIHGGSIAFSSKPGNTIFSILLPMSAIQLKGVANA